MTRTIQAENVDAALLIVRLVASVIFMAHGAQKLFGVFGGPGLMAIVGMLGPVGYLVSIGEFFGGLGLMVGFLSRFSAAALTIIMLGAIAMVHGANGFFLAPKMGYEYNLALIAMLTAILLAGPGVIRWRVGWGQPQAGGCTSQVYGRPCFTSSKRLNAISSQDRGRGRTVAQGGGAGRFTEIN